MSNETSTNVLVTGANGGLGLHTIRHLVADGVGRLVMAGRTLPKLRRAKDELATSVPRAARTNIELADGFDMTSPESIRAAVGRLDPHRPFDVVFLQAGGVVYGSAWKTVQVGGTSVERTIFQNVVGAHLTLMALVERGLVARGARVVIAGGEGARGIPGLIACPHFESAQDLRDYATVADDSRPYVAMNAMGVSKFAGALWAMQAAELYRDDFEVLWFTPGLTAGTSGLQGVGRIKQWIFEKIMFPLMVLLGKAQTAAAGGRKFADSLQGKIGRSGDILGAPEGQALGKIQDQTPMNPDFSKLELRRELWALLEEIGGPVPRGRPRTLDAAG